MRRKRADMIGGEETLAKLRTLAYAWDRTADGKSIVYSLGNDLWQLPLEGARTPIQLTSAPTGEHYGQVSPDGRWLAYAPGDRSDMEVYAQPTSPTGAQWLISTDNRSMPRWRRDGKELFYRAGDGRLMVVPVLASSDRGLFSHGAPRPLPLSIPDVGNVPRFKYQPSADGQRFLLTLNAQSAANPSS